MSGDLIITNLFIFALAGFLGFEVIRRVPKLLHTPLMALTNALSAIAVVGGFLITDKMLKMFKKREPAKPRSEAETEASP